MGNTTGRDPVARANRAGLNGSGDIVLHIGPSPRREARDVRHEILRRIRVMVSRYPRRLQGPEVQIGQAIPFPSVDGYRARTGNSSRSATDDPVTNCRLSRYPRQSVPRLWGVMPSPAAPAQRRKGFRIAAFRPEFGLNPRPRRVAAPALLNACVAEKSAKRVYGVKAVVNDLEIKLLGDGRCIDEDIAGGGPRCPQRQALGRSSRTQRSWTASGIRQAERGRAKCSRAT